MPVAAGLRAVPRLGKARDAEGRKETSDGEGGEIENLLPRRETTWKIEDGSEMGRAVVVPQSRIIVKQAGAGE